MSENLAVPRILPNFVSDKYIHDQTRLMNTLNGRQDTDILFSRTVKAGRRVYYVDVKQDRRGGYYVSVTESKRVRDGIDGQNPLFEKHKIFLYREDLEKFIEAFSAAAEFAANQPAPEQSESQGTDVGDSSAVTEQPTETEPEDNEAPSGSDGDFSVEF